MNRWDCEQANCKSCAIGEGSAIGLRAIGWYVRTGSGFLLFCPAHHPEFNEVHMRTAQMLLASTEVEKEFTKESFFKASEAEQKRMKKKHGK